MPEWSKQRLGMQAKELGFVRDTYEKVCRLTEILKFIDQDSVLRNSLALKGGTAINLLIFNLPRLSVDIDLDFIENVSREEMLLSRSIISERIEKYMKANRYTLSQKSKKFHALDSLVFDYTNSAGMKDNIKVEINYMLRSHLLGTTNTLFNSTWEPEEISVRCVAPIEIFGSKIVALINRTAARDLYDLYRLVNDDLFTEPEKGLLRKCVVFYSAISSESPLTIFQLDNIDSFTQRQIKTDLYPVLRNNDKFDLKSAKRDVKTWLEDLLQLDTHEQEFLKAFRSGSYLPELLFGSSEISERIQNHPMALWRCSQAPITP